MKPIQDAIESLHRAGRCPRLHIDVTHEDAVCPDFVSEKWGQRLIIDLDPSYPLELEFTPVGVEANLSFGGYVTRCTFPWLAIYVVADRDKGRGQVFASHIPAALRQDYGLPPTAAVDPELTKVQDDARAKKSSRRRKRRRSEAEAEAEPARPRPAIGLVEAADADEDADEPEDNAAEDNAAEDDAAEDDAAEDKQSVAQARRSAFKVIDGGD